MAHWKELALQKRVAQFESIPIEWRLDPIPRDFIDSTEVIQSSPILTENDKEITKITDAAVLLAKMAKRELTCVQVTTAFCKRAAIAHQLINCCTEMFFQRAIAQATQLDSYLEKSGKLVGPLHGLPISIKDGFDVEGVDSTLGTLLREICVIG